MLLTKLNLSSEINFDYKSKLINKIQRSKMDSNSDEEKTLSSYLCPKGHILEAFKIPHSSYRCDILID